MKNRLLSVTLAITVLVLTALASKLVETATRIIPARVDAADAVTVENGIVTYHYTVTAKAR